MGASRSGAAMATQIQAMTEIDEQILRTATDAFDSEEKALRWLREPNLQTGNQPPITLTATPEGVRAVEIILNQIKFAIFA
jgi:uncharacterized protein (DUF2384 family)